MSNAPEQIASILKGWGEPAYRLTQVEDARRAGAREWDEVTTLPKDLRTRLAEVVPLWSVTPDAMAESRDGTIKWRLRTHDAMAIESVLIKHARGRRTLCVSSQAGCALGCRFCATGKMGAGRDLTAREIADQAWLAADAARAADARLSNIVFMGMGEPLQNTGAVFDAIREMHAPEGLGISARSIAVSTAGWVPGIEEMVAFEVPVRLALSLHAADDDTRSALMPINNRWPIANVLAACRRYADRTGRRVFIEYLLLDGVNDNVSDARRLATQLRDGRFHVNLIEYNATGGEYRGSPPDRARRFSEALQDAGLFPSLRRSRGSDIAAACGQLATTA
jgi:23S rRNA (adenine2503-C2)-methyltransferase